MHEIERLKKKFTASIHPGQCETYANDVLSELSQQAVGGSDGAQRQAQQRAHESTRNALKEKTTTGAADDRISLTCENLQDSSAEPAEAYLPSSQ